MPPFRLVAPFRPTGDQPQAIDRLADGLARGVKRQTLLGATGTGKSLVPDEPVLIGRQDRYGRVTWSVESIGGVVDAELRAAGLGPDPSATVACRPGGDGGGLLVATVDPATHGTVVRPVYAVSRHTSPPTMYRVTTLDGRAVTVTPDHNFVRLGSGGRLETVETAELGPGDSLPLPVRLPQPANPLSRFDVAHEVGGAPLYVRGPAVLDRSTPVAARRSLQPPARAPLAAVGAAGVAVMERFGPPQISARRGVHALDASIATDDAWMAQLGLFVAEGHVASRFATIAPGPESIDLARDLLDRSGIRWFDRGRCELGIGSRVATETLRALCGERAGNKHLPAFWASLDDHALGRLLAGYFEGDGWVENRGAAVLAVTKSTRLANELAYALLRFGVVARLSRTRKRAVGTPHEGADYWQIAIRGADDIGAFARFVGFLGSRKQAQLAAIVNASVAGNTDVLPPQAAHVLLDGRLALGVRQQDLAAAAGLSRAAVGLLESGRRSLRRSTGRRLLRALTGLVVARGDGGSPDALAATDTLERLLACRWTEVASVEPVAATSASVYDLSVAGAETFFAGFGGLVVHNTYTIASVIEKHQKPTLVLAHNKTLAAQLYSEFREFFPENAVEYFVSYFDYYQPEAYLPRSDTYIEKDSSRNDEIDKLRHAATKALFERRDVIIVASVSCIYGLGAPVDYGATVIRLRVGGQYRRDGVLRQLVDLQYQRNDASLTRARFRVRGDTLELQPAYDDFVVRVQFFGDEVERIVEIDPLTGEMLAERKDVSIYPASHYVTPVDKLREAIVDIEAEMEERCTQLDAQGRVLEAARLRQRTTFDLEMMRELGFCSGIENYSRHLARRPAGSRPWTLLDYFPPDWLLVVDESHMTIPQVVGMYKNDRTRKEILVDFGFRLPSALDNRPLTFEEFDEHLNQVIYMSATPAAYEMQRSEQVAEQLIRPTGIVDPRIHVRKTRGQIDDLLDRIHERVARGERVLVTTLTKKMAEDLAEYLRDLGVKVSYLHSEVDTLERVQILRDLRLGVYDVLVGINLLREGIDLPEVTLVAILDADKEGFLRSAWSLIQVAGRAARNVGGEVVMYADTMTDSMKLAISETERRRAVQMAYNTEHGIEPTTIVKEVRDLNDRLRAVAEAPGAYVEGRGGRELSDMSREQVAKLVSRMEAEMRAAARELEFEKAAALRDEIQQVRLRVLEEDASLEVERAAERAAVTGAGADSRGRRGPAVVGATARGSGAGRQRPGRASAATGGRTPGREGRGGTGIDASEMRVSAVEVLPAGDEPVAALDEPGREGQAPGATDEGTASDWLPGIRDEHDDDGGWQAKWLERQAWDHRVTPNVIRRTGQRPRRRR